MNVRLGFYMTSMYSQKKCCWSTDCTFWRTHPIVIHVSQLGWMTLSDGASLSHQLELFGSNQWSNEFPSCCCLGENDVQKNPCCIKLGRLLQEFPANQPDQPTWPLFNDDQRLSLGPNYWSESWNSNEAINSLNLPGRHATPHSINFKEHPLFVWFILGILRVYLGRNSRTKTLKNSM